MSSEMVSISVLEFKCQSCGRLFPVDALPDGAYGGVLLTSESNLASSFCGWPNKDFEKDFKDFVKLHGISPSNKKYIDLYARLFNLYTSGPGKFHPSPVCVECHSHLVKPLNQIDKKIVEIPVANLDKWGELDLEQKANAFDQALQGIE